MKGKRGNSEQGQISLMVGLMMLTFLFFFCFVVNIGMLVNAKINLQNAADLAAYAGAAVQARQLNSISYLNYEMRRQYKKFLFRYYIVGTMAQATMPKTVSESPGATARVWAPKPGGTDYNVPVVCVIFNANDNYCQIGTSPAIVAPLASNFDAINSALVQQLANIEQIRQNNCITIGVTNQALLQLWLWNTDPTVQNLIQSLQAEQFNTSQLQVIAGLGQGLGLMPRNLILNQRIQTLAGYVNAPNQTGVTFEGTQSLRSGADPSKYERTIQAFFSAYLTLGNHTFWDPTQITMDELMPQGQQGNANLLNLNQITASFDTFALSFALNSKTDPAEANIKAADCVPQSTLQQNKQGLVVGVVKDPSVLTYYAIRLQAHAHVMFNPFGSDILLTAYSAARPFGSRIGPTVTEADFIRTAQANMSPSYNNSNGQASHVGAPSPIGQIPNLAIQIDEGTDKGKGWDTNEAQGSFFGTAFSAIGNTSPSFNPNGNSAGPKLITAQQLTSAYQIAMAPNPEEEGYYNIPNDMDQDFAPAFDGHEEMVLWAPIAPPDQPGTAITSITSTLNSLITETDNQTSLFKQAAATQIGNYINSLAGGQTGDDGETMNTVHLKNPFFNLYDQTNPSNLPTRFNLPDWMMPDETAVPGKILTSWNHPNDATYRSQEQTQGRGGYSVKFVSFDSLTGNTPTRTTQAGSVMTNMLNNVDASTDLGAEMSH